MEAIGQLAGGIAHDFNNLLTAILGYGELLLDGSPTDAPQRADLEEILKAGERAATRTRQLLAFSRQQVLEPRVVNLNELVSGIQRLLMRVIGEDVEIVTDLAPVLGRVKVDPGQVEQVLMNLAVNARDAMPRGGRLTVRTSECVLSDASFAPHAEMECGTYVLMAVSDTGTGISPDIQSRIYVSGYLNQSASQSPPIGAEFLPKPFTPATLLRKVRAILETGETGVSRTMTGPVTDTARRRQLQLCWSPMTIRPYARL